MFTEYLIAIGGVLGVLLLADIVVLSSMRLAHHWGLSGTFVGLTILSIGTSIPEILSAIIGGLNILRDPSVTQSMSGIILGQNVGSDIFQQMFVLAIVGLVGTVVVVKKDLGKEVGGLIAGAVVVLIFSIGGTLSRFEGFLLLALYIGYLIYLYAHRKKVKIKPAYHLSRMRIVGEGALIVVAFIGMGFIADQVLGAANSLAAHLPVSASFLGVVLLGVASALPELTTALIGVLKHQKGVSAGVLIGSNITNPMMGLGLGAMVSGFSVPNVVVMYDLPVKIGTALLIYWFLTRNEKLSKWEAVVLLALFGVYLFVRQVYFPGDF